jgi:hypothetical protein
MSDNTVDIESRLRLIRGIAGLIMTNINLDGEDARAGAEAIDEFAKEIQDDPGNYPQIVGSPTIKEAK